MLFLIGAVFGLRGGRWPYAVAANAIAGIALPAACYAAHPAWMWGYLVDPARVSVAVVVAIFALYWVPFAIGLRTRSWWALGGGALAQVALIAITWPRYSTITTMEGFAAGVQVPPSQVPLVAWGGPVAFAVVLVLLWLARPMKRAPAPAAEPAPLHERDR